MQKKLQRAAQLEVVKYHMRTTVYKNTEKEGVERKEIKLEKRQKRQKERKEE